MRLGLAHDQIVAQRIHLAALVAGHHPSRHAGRAHQEHEGRSVVLAEAAARLEQEFVHRVAAQLRRDQGVEEQLRAEQVQHVVD